ncbi:hypothetical protein [Lentzea aerocolonigenes]|uniref:hypothetical protein n=1 Tax=Lentzea aerocolonigenes TaxID=68170 RepID=UPI0012DD3CBF|nr:hypothetical protein [Lentzea aerocolonigenes]
MRCRTRADLIGARLRDWRPFEVRLAQAEQEGVEQLATVRQALGVVEDARAQTVTRAERAERQLDELMTEPRALRAATPK